MGIWAARTQGVKVGGGDAMMPMSSDDFAKRMMLLARPADQFEPSAVYDPDGDCIEFLAKPDPFYAERVDDLVTVYYSQETNEVVGSLLKGVTDFYKKLSVTMPGFQIEVRAGRVRLVHVFRAQLWGSTTEPRDLATLSRRKCLSLDFEGRILPKMVDLFASPQARQRAVASTNRSGVPKTGKLISSTRPRVRGLAPPALDRMESEAWPQ